AIVPDVHQRVHGHYPDVAAPIFDDRVHIVAGDIWNWHKPIAAQIPGAMTIADPDHARCVLEQRVTSLGKAGCDDLSHTCSRGSMLSPVSSQMPVVPVIHAI